MAAALALSDLLKERNQRQRLEAKSKVIENISVVGVVLVMVMVMVLVLVWIVCCCVFRVSVELVGSDRKRRIPISGRTTPVRYATYHVNQSTNVSPMSDLTSL